MLPRLFADCKDGIAALPSPHNSHHKKARGTNDFHEPHFARWFVAAFRRRRHFAGRLQTRANPSRK
jgi:hypothetical protein